MLKRTLLFLLTLLTFATWAGPAIEQSPDRLILILDASGSMWGQISGENKIVIARRVIKNLLNQLGDRVEVGLVAYGHRREKDCDDIEIVKRLSVLDRAVLTQQIDAINPKGKTPITGAFRTAVESVRPENGATTIVLFTDGLETCGDDPCQAVSRAKAAGVDFVMHVIGFDVGKEDVSQLECAAQAAGGLYLGAENADELAAAFDRTVAPVAASNAFLSVQTVANGELIDTRVTVFRNETREEIASGRTYTSEATNPRLLPVAAGEYDVEVQALKFKGDVTQTFRNIQVVAGDTVMRVVDFSMGELAVKVTRNGELSDATINVFTAGTKKRITGGRSYNSANSNPKVFKLTPGSYDVVIGSVEISGKPEKRLENVTVTAGKKSEHAHNFESGTLRIGAVNGAALVDAVVKVTDIASGAQTAQGRTYTSANSNPKTFELPPGRYRVTVGAIKVEGNPERSLEVTVGAGETAQQTIDFAK